MLSLDVKAIGTVRATGDGRALLQVLPAYAGGLDGLRAGDRVQLLYWMHELAHADRRSLRVHPGGDQSEPTRGVFGLRSCVRPNPVGVSEVEVLEVRAAGLVVAELDAREGSPIVDIKLASR